MTAAPPDEGYGAPPRTGWAKLVCELLVEDLAVSRAFWQDVLGFGVAYQRPEQGFVYLERPEGAQIMLCQRSGNWETAALERPFGRGVMFQVFVDDLAPIQAAVAGAGRALHAGPPRGLAALGRSRRRQARNCSAGPGRLPGDAGAGRRGAAADRRWIVTGYLIRPMTEADLPRVSAWRASPHVVEWWGDPSLEPEIEKLADPRIAMWVVEHKGRPFAFIQDYDVHGWSPHPFDYLPKGARGMDLYIGEADMVGRGHGQRFLRQHVERMFADGVPAAGADPHPDNLRARRAYEKAGFAVVSEPLDTPWGHAVLMDRRA